MTRLSAEPMATDEVHTVVTDLDLTHTAKVVWTYMRAVTDPQHMKSMAEVLGMANGTVIRSLKALEAKGLVRRVSGVWLPEVPQ